MLSPSHSYKLMTCIRCLHDSLLDWTHGKISSCVQIALITVLQCSPLLQSRRLCSCLNRTKAEQRAASCLLPQRSWETNGIYRSAQVMPNRSRFPLSTHKVDRVHIVAMNMSHIRYTWARIHIGHEHVLSNQGINQRLE